MAELVPEPPGRPMTAVPPRRRRVRLPVLLFIATCLSTLLAGTLYFGPEKSWMYALCVMTILLCHEMGHFLQARRYGVYASLPYFIPMPISPIGTFGAVIAMGGNIGHRRALFDIGITGPLAGLVPTIAFCIVGLHWSDYTAGKDQFGDPVLFKFLAEWMLGPMPKGQVIKVHPMAFAGWVGLLITALNLIPIGQLDGGHILYALLRSGARRVASLLLLTAAAAVVWNWDKLHGWTLMLFLLMLMGPHPPTGDDEMPLGPGRIILGWLTLAFIPVGFTPTPFMFGQ